MITDHDGENKKLRSLLNDLSERITQNFSADVAKLIIQFMNRMYANPVTYRESRHDALATEIKMLACWLEVYEKRKQHNQHNQV